jgi:hypothetical protein
MPKVELGVVKLIKQGQHYALALTEQQKQVCQNLFAICDKKHNLYCRVEFSTPKRKRTTGEHSQNAHLNGHIQQISEETGNPFDLVKLMVKEQAIDMGYPMLLNSNGEPVTGLYGIRLAISESEASIEECKLLIDSVHLIAGELDIILREE